MTVARERTVRMGGAHVLVREVGEGPPILLVNGLGAHTAMWAGLEESLRGFRILSFDAPGTGRSTTPALPVGVKTLARLATRVLDHFEVEQADVLGYSLGGIVVQQLCADHPSRVRRAVLAATSPGLGGFHGDAKSMLNIATPARYLSPRLYMATIGSLAGGRARTDQEWIARQGTLRLSHAPTVRGYLSQLAGLTGWSGLPLLRRIPHPVLVITGDDDPLTPIANAMMLAHLLPGGRLLVLPGEGHLLLMDAEGPALSPVRQFLAVHELEGSEVWDQARDIDAETLQIALAGAGTRQLQPYGLVSSILRRRHLDGQP